MSKKEKTGPRSPMAVKGSEIHDGMSMAELEAVMTLQQIEFCRKYVLYVDARRAAEEVGYVDYKRLMVNPKVKHYIARLQKKLSERFNLTADRVIQELCKIGFINPADLYKDGALQRPHELPGNVSAAISEITEEIVGFDKANNQPLTRIKYKFHSKTTALDMLAKHLGLYERDNDQKRPVANVSFYLPSNGRDPKLDAKRNIIDITPNEKK